MTLSKNIQEDQSILIMKKNINKFYQVAITEQEQARTLTSADTRKQKIKHIQMCYLCHQNDHWSA